MRPRLKKALLLVVGVPALLILCLVLYLSFGDLGGLCGLAEDAATRALGRELRIDGQCRPELWSPARLLAEDITLAGPAWSTESALLRVDRLAISLDLWSFVDRPVRVHDLRLEGARVLLEKDASGRANWEFPAAVDDEEEIDNAPDTDDSAVLLIAESVEIENVEVVYLDAAAEIHHTLTIDWLSLGLDEDGMMRLDTAATLDDLVLEISGEIGPQEELLRAGGVSAQLEARLAEMGVEIEAAFSDLATLREPRLEVSAAGRDIAAVTAALGTPSLGSGPFHLVARLDGEALDGEADVVLEASLGDLEAFVEGRVSSVLDPRALDVEVEASGLDLAAIGELAGVDSLPAVPFDLTGALVWDESSLRFDRVSAHVGESSLEADGTLAFMSTSKDLALAFAFEGPDLSWWAEIANLALPAVPFRGEGKLTGNETGSTIEAVHLAVGTTSLEASGTLGGGPDFYGSALDLDLVSDDPSVFKTLAGVDLPSEGARLTGRVTYARGVVEVDGLAVTLGEHEAEADGSIELEPGLAGTDLRLRVAGPDLASLVAMIPREAPDLPSEPYAISGRVAVVADGYLLEALEARAGDFVAGVEGRVGLLPELEGTDVVVAVEGPRLSDLEKWAELPVLPAEPFTGSGSVRAEGGVFFIRDAKVSLGDERLEAEGAVGPFPDLAATDIEMRVGGPNVRQVVEYLVRAELVSAEDLPELPGERWAVEGGVRAVDAGYELTGVVAHLGEVEVRVDGTIGTLPQLVGTDVALRAKGPSLAAVGAIAAVELPVEPFELEGRLTRSGSGTRMEAVRASLGLYRLEVDGKVGDSPGFEGSNLDLHLSGPGSTLVAEYLDFELPEGPLDVVGHITGSRAQFAIEGLRATVGESDLSGSLRADLRETPDVDVDLHSGQIDLRRLLKGIAAKAEEVGSTPGDDPVKEGAPEEIGAEAVETEDVAGDGELLIPDDPLRFDNLRSANGTVRFRADSLQLPGGTVRDIELGAELRNGRLQLLPTSAIGPAGASFTASLTLAPEGGGYRLGARITADRLALLGALSEGVEGAVPTINLDLDLKGVGTTPHDLVSHADGILILEVNPGFVASRVLDFLGGDITFRMLGAVNPFDDPDRNTEIECVVVLGRLEDGLMTVDPAILRTARMDLLGKAGIDFETEALDLSWTIKKRKGLGLSVALFTDSSVKLGGTLANPRIEVTPLDYAMQRTKTVATAGVWPALQSFWNRVTAGQDRCGKALKVARAARREFRRANAEAGSRP